MARSLHSFGRTAKDIHFQEVPFASVGRTRRATLAAKQPHSERDRHSFDRLRRQWQAIHRKDKDGSPEPLWRWHRFKAQARDRARVDPGSYGIQ